MILLADSEDPDQTAWICSLIWVFTVSICLKTGFCMMWSIIWTAIIHSSFSSLGHLWTVEVQFNADIHTLSAYSINRIQESRTDSPDAEIQPGQIIAKLLQSDHVVPQFWNITGSILCRFTVKSFATTTYAQKVLFWSLVLKKLIIFIFPHSKNGFKICKHW